MIEVHLRQRTKIATEKTKSKIYENFSNEIIYNAVELHVENFRFCVIFESHFDLETNDFQKLRKFGIR